MEISLLIFLTQNLGLSTKFFLASEAKVTIRNGDTNYFTLVPKGKVITLRHTETELRGHIRVENQTLSLTVKEST